MLDALAFVVLTFAGVSVLLVAAYVLWAVLHIPLYLAGKRIK